LFIIIYSHLYDIPFNLKFQEFISLFTFPQYSNKIIHRYTMYRITMYGGESMKINKELLKGSTTVLILSILNRKDMYGYEMIKEIDLRSKGIFSFKEGTLYPILHNLENANYIESYWDDSNSGRKRKYYKITDNGKKLLLEKESEWKLFSETVNSVLWEGSLCLK